MSDLVFFFNGNSLISRVTLRNPRVILDLFLNYTVQVFSSPHFYFNNSLIASKLCWNAIPGICERPKILDWTGIIWNDHKWTCFLAVHKIVWILNTQRDLRRRRPLVENSWVLRIRNKRTSGNVPYDVMLSGVSDIRLWVLLETLMLRWLFCLFLRLRGDLLPAAAVCVSMTACWPDSRGSSGTSLSPARCLWILVSYYLGCYHRSCCAFSLFIWQKGISLSDIVNFSNQCWHFTDLSLLLNLCQKASISRKENVKHALFWTALNWAEMIDWQLHVNFLAYMS